MNESVSVVFPVYNVEATLCAQVDELLDVLPEMSSEFEIVIVDDGSVDQTYEVGIELAWTYPQIKTIRLGQRAGTIAAIRTGIQRTSGEVILVQDQLGPINISDIRRLWQLRHDPNLLIARAEGSSTPLNTNMIHRLMEWGTKLKDAGEPNSGGIQMIRRKAIHRLSDLDPSESGMNVTRIDQAEDQPKRRKSERQIVNERLERLTKIRKTKKSITLN